MSGCIKALDGVKWIFVLLIVVFLASGCVLAKPNSLLSTRKIENPPDLVGRYLDDNKQEIRLLGHGGAASNNTFVAYPPNKKNPLTITFERLSGSRYIIQMRPEGETEVGLTVAEIELPKVTVYVFPKSQEEITQLAKKRNVVLSDKMVITEYHSVPDIIGLFNDLFTIKNKEALVFIKQKK
jgi:hypothetical protein